LLLVLLAACSIYDDYNVNLNIDDGFFSGNPCGPPCLLGIVPGVSKEAEVLKILRDKDFQECDAFNREDQGGIRGVSCRFSGRNNFRPYIGINFQPDTDIVNNVSYNPLHKITVGDVISRYGEPDAVFVAEIGTPEIPHIGMVLFYDGIQTTLNLPEQDGVIFRAESSTEIESIGYSASYSLSRNEFMDFLQKWKGYGEYRQIDLFN
jgi:hypothetical protein